MTLPMGARARLTEPLRTAAALPRTARGYHTLPIESTPWRVYSDALGQCLAKLRNELALPDRSFNGLRDHLVVILRERSRAAGMLRTLEPFQPYDPMRAAELLDVLDNLPVAVSSAVEAEAPLPAELILALDDAAVFWTEREAPCAPGTALRSAFGMPHDPTDAQGSFRPELVLQHYAHRAESLLRILVPHLVSVGVPYVKDALVGIAIVGRILNGEDPVLAYLATDMLSRGYLGADPAVAAEVRSHLGASEAALRRTEHSTRLALIAAKAADDDMEARALAVADAYKRTVEGPFRRFSWAVHCLHNDQWSEPPMVAGLRQRLLAAGGSLAAIAEVAVLPNMRNSETHESLAWDGFSEHYVTEEGQVPYNVVVTALQVASSFVQGAEAGLAAIRALHAVDDVTELPAADDEGRMPSADRIRGFFGTNRLILVEARLNSPHARFRVQRLGVVDINPCFQALLLSRRLLPRTKTFEVTAVDTAGSLLTVDADALDATMPGWEYAVSHLDQMPLATFLPANYSARTKTESAADAIRAVAWIAADDAVGVIDGSLEAWSAEVRRLLAVRLQVIAIALEHTRGMLSTASPRLDSVHESVVQLRRWIETDHPRDPWVADDQPALQKLRSQWEVWGPVPRLPTVTQEPTPDEVSQAQPRLRVVHQRDYQAF